MRGDGASRRDERSRVVISPQNNHAITAPHVMMSSRCWTKEANAAARRGVDRSVSSPANCHARIRAPAPHHVVHLRFPVRAAVSMHPSVAPSFMSCQMCRFHGCETIEAWARLAALGDAAVHSPWARPRPRSRSRSRSRRRRRPSSCACVSSVGLVRCSAHRPPRSRAPRPPRHCLPRSPNHRMAPTARGCSCGAPRRRLTTARPRWRLPRAAA